MNVMKHYFRIWINAVILCMLVIATSACKDDDFIENSPPWPDYPDLSQEILRIVVENEHGENLLNPDTE